MRAAQLELLRAYESECADAGHEMLLHAAPTLKAGAYLSRGVAYSSHEMRQPAPAMKASTYLKDALKAATPSAP